MNRKIKFFIIIILIYFFSDSNSEDLIPLIEPEHASKFTSEKKKYAEGNEIIVVTANDYATKIGYEILDKGGSVVDAAVAIQLTLGLVEPQSSGLGGGLFLTYFDSESNKVLTYDGRESAPINIKKDIFLNKNGKPKKFFEAAIGGASVGVPSSLKTLQKIHNEYGKLEWEKTINPVIELSKNGFLPPDRLINALKKERFFFKENPDSLFKNILLNPKKKVFNHEYTKTLNVISKNFGDFYEGKIAENIVEIVKKSQNSGMLSLDDLKNYKPEKKKAFCHRLKNNFLVCGPNLPSSGTICILQTLILFEDLNQKKKKINLNQIMEILDFVYYLRDIHLADEKFAKIDIKKLLSIKFLIEEFELFKKNKHVVNFKNFDEVFSSTSHFSLVDKYNNVMSLTSSIESSFGSRLFIDGFFLNNQLTDFSFKIYDKKGNPIKNSVEGGKRPLSSMSPLIIFDENDKFFLTIGSPGGKAIISYVSRVLIDFFYFDLDLKTSLNSPNFLRIKGKSFVENEEQNKKIENNGLVRSLTSGLAVIKKEKGNYIGIADKRRDGTVRGK
ncbi:MAG: hypothetical protein CMM95_02055 [Rickettsiales bacterium]|nr:hypothetical protein [Rickettsiales bacterium]